MSKRNDKNIVTSALSFLLLVIIVITAIATLLPPSSPIRSTVMQVLEKIGSSF